MFAQKRLCRITVKVIKKLYNDIKLAGNDATVSTIHKWNSSYLKNNDIKKKSELIHELH